MNNTILPSTPQTYSYPKYVFLHLLVTVTLYWTAVSFITLLFQYVNFLVPDPLTSDSFLYGGRSAFGPLRFAIASLIVVFPVFVGASWLLNRDYQKSPTIRNLRLRKWLIYLTLFIAALVIIGSLVRIIFTFLEGDLTLRFILKALSMIVVTGAIFGYYLYDVKEEQRTKGLKTFARTVIVIVVIAVIGAFFIVGSPAEERLHRFDDERVENLNTIQQQIIFFWQSKERLPEQLAALEDEISGFRVPVDPETAEPYEYRVIDETTFELCATFNRTSVSVKDGDTPRPLPLGEMRPMVPAENWDHDVGRTCFERAIDPELYPPFDRD